VKEFARLDGSKSRTNRFHRYSYGPISETHCKNHHDADIETRQILLKLQPSISSQEHVKPILRAPEQLTVRITRPALFLNRSD